MRFVEELDGDVLHLLLVHHAEMCAVTGVVLAQGAGLVPGRRHYCRAKEKPSSVYLALSFSDQRVTPVRTQISSCSVGSALDRVDAPSLMAYVLHLNVNTLKTR